MTTFLSRHSEPDDHIAQLRWLGHDVRIVSGGDDKAGVLDAFATDLELPDWFGRNWDALVDAGADHLQLLRLRRPQRQRHPGPSRLISTPAAALIHPPVV